MKYIIQFKRYEMYVYQQTLIKRDNNDQCLQMHQSYEFKALKKRFDQEKIHFRGQFRILEDKRVRLR